MADQPSDQPSFFARLREDPAVKELVGNIGGYASAKAEDIAKRKMPGAEDATGVIDAGKKEAKREAVVPAVKGFFKGAWKKLTKGSKQGKRPINILETATIGAPVEMVWDEWLNFEQWPNYMKGPEKVQENDDGTSQWTAKVFVSRRQWKSEITEKVEYERLRWKSEAPKGQVDGVVTFAPAGENLTFCVLVMEYRRKGFFEGVGNLWRAQGRRARLDFKHFQRHVAMADQAGALGQDGDDERSIDRDGDGDSGNAGGAGPAERAGESGGTEPAGGAEPAGAAGESERAGESEGAGDAERQESVTPA